MDKQNWKLYRELIVFLLFAALFCFANKDNIFMVWLTIIIVLIRILVLLSLHQITKLFKRKKKYKPPEEFSDIQPTIYPEEDETKRQPTTNKVESYEGDDGYKYVIVNGDRIRIE